MASVLFPCDIEPGLKLLLEQTARDEGITAGEAAVQAIERYLDIFDCKRLEAAAIAFRSGMSGG